MDQKIALFSTVDNFATVSGRNVCDMSKGFQILSLKSIKLACQWFVIEPFFLVYI